MKDKKHLCDCGAMAVWCYMPGYVEKDSNKYSCDDCVHRGCSCNHYSINPEHYAPFDPDFSVKPKEEDNPIKWIDKDTWTHVDEKGREYPCCEYEYCKEGFEVSSEEELAKIKEEMDIYFDRTKKEQ